MTVHRWVSVVGLSVLILVYGESVQAQYMYLDANGDSLNTIDDRLSATGETTVDIWLDTNHNRDGSIAICVTGEALTVNSYEFILHADGGIVSWAGFANHQPTMTTSFGVAMDSTDYHNGLGSGAYLAPGRFKLASIGITVVSGAPIISLAPATPLMGGFLTSFGSQCVGSDLDNTLKLGTDWTDADGLMAPAMPPDVSAPASISTEEGADVAIEATAVAGSSGSAPTLTAQGYPASLALEIVSVSPGEAQATLSGHLGANDAGIYTIIWTASDESGASSTDSTTMDIAQHDFPPEVFAPATASGPEGSPLSVVVSAYDDDNDDITSLTATLGYLPVGNNATFVTNASHTQGTLSWTPAYDHAGTYKIRFTACNWVCGSDSTMITITNAIPEWLVRIQAPQPGARLDVYFFLALCVPNGSPCDTKTYYADANGYAYVPLNQCSADGSTCLWWERVVIETQMKGPGAEIGSWDYNVLTNTWSWDIAMYPTVELNPASVPADRVLSYTIPAAPWLVATLDMFADVRAYFAGALTVPGQPPAETTGPVHLILSDTFVGFRDSDDDASYPGANIFWPNTSAYMATISPLPVQWMVAHEYAHALQRQAWPFRRGNCQSESHCTDDQYYLPGSNTSDDPEYYERLCLVCSRNWNAIGCNEISSRRRAWTEGIADGLAELFYSRSVDPAGTAYLTPQPCIPGSDTKIRSVAGFVAAILDHTPTEFWYRLNNVTWSYLPNPLTIPIDRVYSTIAQTVNQFHSLWLAQPPDFSDALLSGSAVSSVTTPGSWNIDGTYVLWILNSSVSGVAGEPLTRPLRLDIHPNPAADILTVRLEGSARVGSAEVRIFDVRGRAVRQVHLAAIGSTSTVPLAGLASGLYFAQTLVDGREVYPVRRLVIMR